MYHRGQSNGSYQDQSLLVVIQAIQTRGDSRTSQFCCQLEQLLCEAGFDEHREALIEKLNSKIPRTESAPAETIACPAQRPAAMGSCVQRFYQSVTAEVKASWY